MKWKCEVEYRGKRYELVEGIQVGADFGDLRADVAVDTDYVQAGQACRALIDRHGCIDINAEFVFFETGGNVRMGMRVDIRVDA